jgi:DNA-binding transcriptional regulator YdaS (Cro superfamily)
MKLHQYIKENCLTQESFGVLVGRSKWAVRKWMYGQRMPRPAEMVAIREATRGQVTPDDFFDSRETDSTDGAAG